MKTSKGKYAGKEGGCMIRKHRWRHTVAAATEYGLWVYCGRKEDRNQGEMSEMTVLTGVERNDEDDTGINPKKCRRVRKNRKSAEVGRANEA